MLLKNINRDDFGMIYLSCLRHCLIKKTNEDMDMLFQIVKNIGKELTKRDFSCSLEDLINGNRYFGDFYDFIENYENKDSITLLTHYMLTNLTYINLKNKNKEEEKPNKRILYDTFSTLNFFTNHDIETLKIEKFIHGLINNDSFNYFWEIAKTNFAYHTKKEKYEKVQIELSMEEIDFLCKNAIHYGVGRRTYVTSIIPNFIITIKNHLRRETKEYIIHYILDLKTKDDSNIEDNINNEKSNLPFHFRYKYLGDDCDRASWLHLVNKLKEK